MGKHETDVITGHQKADTHTGAIIKTDTWPRLMRSSKALFSYYRCTQTHLVSRSARRSTVGSVGGTVGGVSDGRGQRLAGVGGVRLARVDDREDGALPVVALADALVDGSGSLGVRLLGPLRVNVLDDRVVGVCNITMMNQHNAIQRCLNRTDTHQ